MKDKITIALITTIIIIFLATISLSFVITPLKEKSITTINDAIPLINEKINEIENSINENITELQQLQSGDNFNLHDPLYKEAISFLEGNTSLNANETIHPAKNLGLRCALVEIVMGNGLYIYELIAFNTVDQGMKYFETHTAYEVNPLIGESYITCVNPPYTDNTFNDTIIDIITIW
jgi:hypothetical protein